MPAQDNTRTAARTAYITAIQNLRASSAATTHGHFRPGRSVTRSSAIAANLAEWGDESYA